MSRLRSPQLLHRLALSLLTIFAGLLLISFYSTWAVKSGIDFTGQQDLRDIDPNAFAYFQRLAPPDRERPLDVAPLGDFRPALPDPAHRKGLIYTQQGFFNPRDPRAFDPLPADLRPAGAPGAATAGESRSGDRVALLQISGEALRTRGIDSIESEIRSLGVRVLESRLDRALVVKGRNRALAELRKAPFVEAAIPYAPAFKIEPATGRQRLLDRIRSGKKELDLHVTAWDPAEVEGLFGDLQEWLGDRIALLEDGATLRATVRVQELKRIARDERVKSLGEIPEYQLSSRAFAEHPPTVMVGENENTGAATPYWDAGVDGGGCGNPATPPTGNTDSRNCSTAVAATVVAVLDNGASTDAATLAHDGASRTEADIASLISGNQHRKIRDYQLVSDVAPLGATCDSVLSGGQTHGNVIAGMIAGNASALGFQFRKNSGAGALGAERLLNLDGVARGARLTIQDAATSSQCTIAEIMERGANVTPGVLATRMDAAYATGARLHVMPFGIPNWGPAGTTSAGSYTADASALDRYLVNNLEYQVFVPVGNRGFSLTNGRDLIPDYFDGESKCIPACTSDPGQGNQISPPATAKNIVTAGAVSEDAQTAFGSFNQEENVENFTSKGPATNTSLRSTPLVVGVGNDRSTTLGAPVPYGIYTVRSRDNNQGGPVETEIDEQARGTSFGAASVASAAALMEDYFRQGFHPTGDRVQGDRVSAVSGSLIKAMLAASANFAEEALGTGANAVGVGGNDLQVASTRGSLITFSTAFTTVLVNNQQGYGRVIASQVLPLANWPDVGVPADARLTGDTLEGPALGLLVWDAVDPDGTGPDAPEPPLTNAAPLRAHHFQVLGSQGQIRACLAWPDPPGDLLVNDLDLEVVDPNGRIYDGNVYNPLNQKAGQWSLGRTGGTDPGDVINPVECVHLTDDPDGDPATSDGQIIPGTWTLRVERGTGGSVPGSLTLITGPDEDANHNNRLDGGEDLDADGLMDRGGQIYAAVVAGPLVAAKDGSNPALFGDYPESIVRLDKIRYSCSDDAVVRLLDSDATAEGLRDAVTLRVLNPAGLAVDTESNLSFSGSARAFTSAPVAVRLGAGTPAAGTPGNGILEGDTGYTLEVIHTDPTPGSRQAIGRAPMDCEPAFLGGLFGNPGQRDEGDRIFGGCDLDSFFDADELLTYSVAVVNDSRLDEYTDVTANLAACAAPFLPDGSCPTPSTVLTVLDTPRNLGRLPAGQPEAVSFSIKVSGSPLSQGPRVYLRLTLAQTSQGKVLGRIAFDFSHAVASDRQSLHYSTDYPNGSGVTTRDLDRSSVIEPVDRPGLTLGKLDETIQFSSLFAPLSGKPGIPGAINNVICTGAGAPDPGCAGADEPYPALGNFTPGSSDTNSNGILDRHVLSDAGPGGVDLIPWSFDGSNGGWYSVRDASSIPGNSSATRPLWHWVKNGTCGFQTQSGSNCVQGNGTPGRVTATGTCASGGAVCTTDRDCGLSGPCAGTTCSALVAGAFTGGVWHTGSGVAGTCSGGGTPGAACYLNDDCAGGTCTGGADNPQCGNYGVAYSTTPATVRRAEFILDTLVSPVLEKVNQGNDANGFPFTVEFQRLAFNDTVQLRYAEEKIYIQIDNDIDHDATGALIHAGNGPRGDRTAYYLGAVSGPIDPYYTQNYYNQRTFGPKTDPDASLVHCSATAGLACTLDSQCPGGEVCGKLTGDEAGFSGFDRVSTNPYSIKPIIPAAPLGLRPFPGPAEPHAGEDTVAGPSRAMEFDLVDYEDPGLQLFTPGDAGNRFQIALSFLTVETLAGGTDGDFGLALDDLVFEWDEVHPVTEAVPSCSRIGTGAGEIAAGCRCATLSVDRTNLYDCNETVGVTVHDARYAAGALAPCAAGNPAVPDTVALRAWSNSEPFPGETLILTETGNATGIFTGTVLISGVFNSPGVVFTTPGSDTHVFFAYEDSQCDASRNHFAGQSDFYNLDGDGIVAASGRDGICSTADDVPSLFGPDGICGYNPATGAVDDLGDNCALVYNPAQGDDDGDRVGGATAGGIYLGCDNCPSLYNPAQTDANHDGVGDACAASDFDGDGVLNARDNCPVTANPSLLPGSDPPAQPDSNFNGIGDACDPAGDFDENRDGIPDDVAGGPFYALAVSCGNLPLAKLAIVAPIFRDRAELAECPGGPSVQACAGGSNVGHACATGADCPGSSCAGVSNACGDGDAFGDPGERVRVGLYLRNDTGRDLSGVTLALSTADPDIECVRDGVITISDFPNGMVLDTRALTPPDDPLQPADGRFFEVVIASTATTTNPLQPARATMALTLSSNEAGGIVSTPSFSLILDLDIPPGAVITPTAARCDNELASAYAGILCPAGDADCGGAAGACKPGLLYEGFESPGPNPGVPKPTGGRPQNNDFSNTLGFIERNALSDSATTIEGKACYGFIEVLGRTPLSGCRIDPDLDTDWHFEVSGTAPNPKAYQGTKSAHWGRHTTASRSGDTTPLREIEAFDTNPINLTIVPGPTDLFLSFWQIVSLVDDNRIGFKVGQAGDRADVQIAVDLDPSPGVDNFGRWQKLVPFQNVYDHTTQVFSWWGYCEFTPTDGAKPDNPGVYGETMCFPDGVWSHSGNVLGTDVNSIFQAQGPGHLGSAGDGVWVQTKFDLRDFVGQRVKVRWIGQGWEFSNGWNSYLEPPGGANPFDVGNSDDGWWIDALQLTGALTTPVAPLVETGSIPLTAQCPATPAGNCDESPGTAGFTVDFRLFDADGDGVVIQGESLLLDASRSANPGGCVDGVPQYRFSRLDGGGTAILQDWSTATSLRLGNTADGDLYQVEVRCSSDFSCTTPPTGPPVGAVPGGCRVFAGSVPPPIEPEVGFVLASDSTDLVMTQPNFLLTGPGTPPHLALPPSTYGHAFLRTDALGVGTGSLGSPSDGGLSGTCAGPQCSINELFRNVILGGSSSCPLLATQHPCNTPTPPVLAWTDGTVPPVGTLYYYLGDVFTTPSGILKVFGNAGSSRTDAGLVDRSAQGTCPGPVTLP